MLLVFIHHADCKVNLDLIFVLDESGSVGPSNFEEVKTFAHDFVDTLTVGPEDTQVGVITYSTEARIRFYLNTYQNKHDTLQAIENVPYQAGWTNTADGICKLIRYGFNETYGARSGAVLRVAVIMTDGQSNRNSIECGTSTPQAAADLKRQIPPIVVFAIGVTDNVNDTELEAIATSPRHITHISSFSTSLLQETQETQTYELCTIGMLTAV